MPVDPDKFMRSNFERTLPRLTPESRLFNRYALRRELGRGGMGLVWLARDETLAVDVALKFLPDLVARDEEAIAQLKAETRHCRQLRHPGIVAVYEFVEDPTGSAIVMEFVDGSTLSELKARNGRGFFEVADIADWMAELCSALDYAHREARVAHRDLKPRNLMLTARGQLKVADFGLARSVSDSFSRVTTHGAVSGTLAYMSPQQASGDAASVSDDVYSIGATIYDLLTGKPPFHTGSIISQIHERVPPAMGARRAELRLQGAEIPTAWEDTVAACLAKSAADRPASAREVAERLLRVGPAPLPRPAQTSVKAEPGRVKSESATIRATPNTDGLARWITKFASVIGLAAITALVVVWARSEKPVGEQPEIPVNAAPVPTARVTQEIRRLLDETDAAEKRGDQFAVRTGLTELLAMDPTNAAVRTRLSAIEKIVGAVKVEAQPAGATVQLGALGERLSTPAVVFTSIPLGHYKVRVSKPGYETQEKELDVLNGNPPEPLAINLRRFAGGLAIESTPPGFGYRVTMKTSVAGSREEEAATRTGTTPDLLSNLPTGEYEVIFSRPGWSEQRRTETVQDGQTVKTEATFPVAAAEIITTPAGAKVSAAGAELGITPWHREDLPAGEMVFELALDGYVPRTVKATLATAQLFRTTVPLGKPAEIWRGTIRAGTEHGVPLTLKFDPALLRGTMTQTARAGDTVVQFSATWEGATLRARTGEVVSKPTGIEWEPESFSVTFSEDARAASYRCEASGKTYNADLAPQ